MLYQKLLLGNKPYFISVGNAGAFEAHRHSEIELSCCVEGSYDIICEDKRYTLNAGDTVVILPMTLHKLPLGNPTSCKCITIELGRALLGEDFKAFTGSEKKFRFYRHDEPTDPQLYAQIFETIKETAELQSSDEAFCELSTKGNLYKLSALLLRTMYERGATDIRRRDLSDIRKIDRAIELIYNSYYEPLSIDTVSRHCGYSKSNFCKTFKSVTGVTFHSMLNRHRIEIACMLLEESDESIERIAQKTGFADIKSFCRVFKQLMGRNAGEYRRDVDHRNDDKANSEKADK